MSRRAWFLAAGLLAGCTVTTPRVAAPSLGPAATGPLTPGEATVGTPPPADWWKLYADADLDAHVTRARAANRDLAVAVGNLAAARGAARLANAQRQPDAVLESGAGVIPANRQPGTTTVLNTSYDLGGEVAWEVDLFGRLRQGASAAQADAEARAAALAGVRIAVTADAVLAYVDLCGALENARLTRSLIAAQERSVAVLERQLKIGETSPLEVAQARTLLERTRATLPAFEADRQRALYQLATLEGLPPREAETFKPPSCSAIPRLPEPLNVGDGFGVIARRPDVAEADRRLAAATARLAVARAEVYPRVRLGLSAGLIDGAVQGFVTPLITWAFINPSRVRARIAEAGGTAEAALANLDVVTLRALREVETNLADLRGERDRLASLETASAEAAAASRRASARVRIGDAPPLLQLDAERTFVDTEQQVAQSRLRRSRLEVQLMRSLGAGG